MKNQSKEKYKGVSAVIQFLPDFTVIPGPEICSGIFETSLTSPQGWLEECGNWEIQLGTAWALWPFLGDISWFHRRQRDPSGHCWVWACWSWNKAPNPTWALQIKGMSFPHDLGISNTPCAIWSKSRCLVLRDALVSFFFPSGKKSFFILLSPSVTFLKFYFSL